MRNASASYAIIMTHVGVSCPNVSFSDTSPMMDTSYDAWWRDALVRIRPSITQDGTVRRATAPPSTKMLNVGVPYPMSGMLCRRSGVKGDPSLEVFTAIPRVTSSSYESSAMFVCCSSGGSSPGRRWLDSWGFDQTRGNRLALVGDFPETLAESILPSTDAKASSFLTFISLLYFSEASEDTLARSRYSSTAWMPPTIVRSGTWWNSNR